MDHRFAGGDTIRVGPLALTAHVTPGHTPGCTSWSFPVHDRGRELLAVSICSLTLLPFDYAGRRDAYERSLRALRAPPADIFLGSHGSFFELARKRRERVAVPDPVAPFLDRPGYLAYIERAERKVRAEVAVE